MSDSRKNGQGDSRGQRSSLGEDAFSGLEAAWRAPFEAMNMWSRAWSAMVERRSAPALDLMMGAFSNPGGWPDSVAPIMQEIERAFALPRFADLPKLDASLLPSAGATLDLMALFQQYLTAMAPMWVKACNRFQADVRERQARGEKLDVASDGMDIWNNALDRTLMEFNRSADFGELQQKMLRMAMKQRQDLRSRVEVVSEALDMPTRSEMLDVYERLHGLMREVHTLRAEVRRLRAAKPAEAAKPSGASKPSGAKPSGPAKSPASAETTAARPRRAASRGAASAGRKQA